MIEIFDQPPNDGGIYQKRKDGKYVRIAAPTVPAPVGITHAARRQGMPAAPAPEPLAAPAAPWGAETDSASSEG